MARIGMLLVWVMITTLTGQAQASRLYDLGETVILQEQFSPDSRFYRMPVALRGVIAVPEGAGPFPVAVVIHGSHGFCTAPLIDDVDPYPCPPEHDLQRFTGLGYMVEALAALGYVAIAPDFAVEYNNGFGEPDIGQRSLQLIEAHVDRLVAGDGFGVDLTGKVNSAAPLLLIGHSRGGTVAMMYDEDTRYATRDVQAVVLLTPAYMFVLSPRPDLPVLMIGAACDGDLGPEDALRFAQDFTPLRTAITVFYTLPRANHNSFNTALTVVDRSEACAEAALLPPDEQRARTVELIRQFLGMVAAFQ
jgi:dienelactone hydrolase